MERNAPSPVTSPGSTGPSRAEREFWTRIYWLAKQCKIEISEEEAGYLDSQLGSLGYEKLVVALDTILSRRDSRDPFPAIRDIKAAVDARLDPETEATEAAARIVQANARIGHTNDARYRKFVGELAWTVVQRSGGTSVIGAMTNSEIAIHRAQWKQIALGLIERARAGLLDEGPSLPPPDRPKDQPAGLIGFGDLMKKIGDHR